MGVAFQYNKGDWYTVPNLLGYLRLGFGWVPAYLILTQPTNENAWWLALVVFGLVSFTDALDGQIARRFNQITDLGKVIDPLADKLLVFLTLIALSVVQPWVWFVTILFTLRELIVNQQIKNRGVLVSAVMSGKIKMVAQIAFIVSMLIPWQGYWSGVQFLLAGFAVYWTVESWIDYHQRFVATK